MRKKTAHNLVIPAKGVRPREPGTQGHTESAVIVALGLPDIRWRESGDDGWVGGTKRHDLPFCTGEQR